jgi:hypothetical protein
MINFRKTASEEMQPHFYGMMQTVWSGAETFLDSFYGKKDAPDGGDETAWKCFVEMYNTIDSL